MILPLQGWELAFVSGGVESSGDKDKQGVYATRYILKRLAEVNPNTIFWIKKSKKDL